MRAVRESTDTRISLNRFIAAPSFTTLDSSSTPPARNRRRPKSNVFTMWLGKPGACRLRRLRLRRSRKSFHSGGATPYLGCNHDPGNSAH